VLSRGGELADGTRGPLRDEPAREGGQRDDAEADERRPIAEGGQRVLHSTQAAGDPDGSAVDAGDGDGAEVLALEATGAEHGRADLAQVARWEVHPSGLAGDLAVGVDALHAGAQRIGDPCRVSLDRSAVRFERGA